MPRVFAFRCNKTVLTHQSTGECRFPLSSLFLHAFLCPEVSGPAWTWASPHHALLVNSTSYRMLLGLWPHTRWLSSGHCSQPSLLTFSNQPNQLNGFSWSIVAAGYTHSHALHPDWSSPGNKGEHTIHFFALVKSTASLRVSFSIVLRSSVHLSRLMRLMVYLSSETGTRVLYQRRQPKNLPNKLFATETAGLQSIQVDAQTKTQSHLVHWFVWRIQAFAKASSTSEAEH